MKRIAKYIFCFVALAGLLMPFPAAAQSCDTMLGSFNNFFLTNTDPAAVPVLDSTIVTNRADGAYASYSEGAPNGIITGSGTVQPAELHYHPAQQVRTWNGFVLWTTPAYAEGTMSSYFSDRRYQPQNNKGFFYSWAPFNSDNVDQITVRIYLTQGQLGWFSAPINPGEVSIVLNSWGNTQLSFQGSCQNGLVTGYLQSPPTNVWTAFVISLTESFDFHIQ